MAAESIFIDPDSFPMDGYGRVQLIFLGLVYGFILSKSSALISDGSELLLLIPSLAGIVGSVVLPILGAVPDGAIVLFSGFGDDAQDQLNVGVGALAGSTIMLLTIPWALCIWAGRVDLVNGEANYKGKPKLTKKRSFFEAGITPKNSISKNGIIMLMTAVGYIIIQGAAFGASCDLNTDVGCRGATEHWWALAALLVCIAAFVGYLVYNVKFADAEDKEDKIEEVKKKSIESHIISLSTAFEEQLDLLGSPTSVNRNSMGNLDDHEKRFNETLKSFFHKYDRNGDGVIDPYELRFLLKDIGEDMPEDKFIGFLKELDSDASGTIEFKEFSNAMRHFIAQKAEFAKKGELTTLTVGTEAKEEGEKSEKGHKKEGEEEEEEEEEEEDEEIPEDLAALPPKTQKLRILWRAAWMMGLGTGVTLLFSDPMVDVLNALGNQFSINPFYIAFVLAPIASNASELIASINYATKRTKKTITISLGALLGAACMNNTFCLFIFLCLIFGRNLIWEFSAETIVIVLIEIALFGFAMKKTHRLFEASFIIALYPFSIFLVWLLENVAGLN